MRAGLDHDRPTREHDRMSHVKPVPGSVTVAAGYARQLAGFAVSRGADMASLLARAGIDPAVLDDYDNRVDFARYAALMREAKAQTGDRALALHFGEAVNLADISILGLICHASATMLDAFVQMNRYGQLVVDAAPAGRTDRFTLERARGALWLVDNRTMPPGFPELAETTFALMICGTRPFGDTPFVHEVHLAHGDPGYRDAYEAVFQAPVRFEAGWNAMRVDEAWLHHPIAVQPRYVFGVLTAHADALAERLLRSGTMRGQVEALILPRLHTGEISAQAAARALGVSRQTLHRRLSAEGCSFSAVLDDLRRQLAESYLAARKVSINETAYLLGYSEPSAFSRAYKRWTGRSPRAPSP